MLVIALVLAVIGLAALVFAVVTSNALVAWVCIGASVLGVLLLIVDALRERRANAPVVEAPVDGEAPADVPGEDPADEESEVPADIADIEIADIDEAVDIDEADEAQAADVSEAAEAAEADAVVIESLDAPEAVGFDAEPTEATDESADEPAARPAD